MDDERQPGSPMPDMSDERVDSATERDEARPSRMFGPRSTQPQRDEIDRINRRRVAMLGLGTGLVMALIVLLCILLLFLAVGRGG